MISYERLDNVRDKDDAFLGALYGLLVMGKNKLNLEGDEELALEVKKYECLYDRASPWYRDRRARINAWLSVEKTLGLEDRVGEKRWKNLRRRYSARKNELRKSKPSTPGWSKAETDLKTYEFMQWMDANLKNYNESKTVKNESLEISDCFASGLENGSGSENGSETESNEDEDEILEANNIEKDNVTKVERIEKVIDPLSKHPDEISPFKRQKMTNSELLATINERLNENEKDEKEKSKEDEHDLFGRVIANELRSLPKSKQIKLKHDINNAIYKYQCEVESEATSGTLPLLESFRSMNEQMFVHHPATTDHQFVKVTDVRTLCSDAKRYFVNT